MKYLSIALLLIGVAVILFTFWPPAHAENKFQTDLSGWGVSSTGSWKTDENGYTGSSPGGNGFLQANAYVSGDKSFIFTGDVVKSEGGGAGLALLTDKGWYCLQVNTDSRSATAFYQKEGAVNWSQDRSLSAEEQQKEIHSVKIEYDGNGKFQFYVNEALLSSHTDRLFAGGFLALKIYQKQTSFNNVFCAEAEAVSYRVSGIFSSNMILQRNVPVTVWGWSEDAEDTVTVKWGNDTVESRVADGKWEVTFPAREASCEASDMTVSSSGSSYITTFENILVGDVWVVSGQSNSDLPMYFTIGANPEFKKEVRSTDAIRIFGQNKDDAIASKNKMMTPQENILNSTYSWNKTTWDNVASFSALGYHFAKALSQGSDVPVGVIMTGCSGAPVSQLMSRELAEKLGYPANADQTIPTSGIYNVFFAPILKLQIKGMIYYQGESDNTRYDVYSAQLQAFVKDLREKFGTEFAFYNVQLSSHGERILTEWPYLPELRNAQLHALYKIPNSYLIVSLDAGWREGDADPAHPFYKKILGERLARLALAKEYGVSSVEYEASPIPSELKWTKEYLEITFSNVADGLQSADGGVLKGFQLLKGSGRVAVDAEIVDSKTVRVPLDSETKAVGYAMLHMAGNEYANLCNGSGLPAPCFEFLINEQISNEPDNIDEFPGPTDEPSGKTTRNSLSNRTILLLCTGILLAGVCIITGIILFSKKRKT